MKARVSPIVGIGASAGGLEALREFFSEIPQETQLAFVAIQHLDPTHPSATVEILTRTTKLPVSAIANNMHVKPGHVYVIQPNTSVTISSGALKTSVRPKSHQGFPDAVDSFFTSLAGDQKEKAIGIILSGTGSDGTKGLRAIKAHGGVAFAQDPKSAGSAGMPQSAIASGAVDIVAPPQEIAQKLVQLADGTYRSPPPNTPDRGSDSLSNPGLQIIFSRLREVTSVDFEYYKQTTIRRRISRRMASQKIETLEDYARFIQANPEEVKALSADLLIHVTEFFRDPDSFESLSTRVFPLLLKDRERGEPIRIWVPGCATGEEAYSIFICLLEYLGRQASRYPIQIFGTDISNDALQLARSGFYTNEHVHGLSSSQLRTFFLKADRGYRIRPDIREMCLFTRHDVTSDPPFAKLDLVCCRNVLIYFSALLQERVIPIFHFALKPTGFLWLGRSESSAAFSNLFAKLDHSPKFYSRINTVSPVHHSFPFPKPDAENHRRGRSPSAASSLPTFRKDADRIVLARYGPPGVVVNDRMEILEFRGHTAAFLEPAPGEASYQLLKMARPELVPTLRSLLQAAKRKNAPSHEDGVRVIPTNPSEPPPDRCFLVLFEGREASQRKTPRPKGTADDVRTLRSTKFQKMLDSERAERRALVEEYEAAQEELTAANEELQSSNEELQSSNEELQSTREELQASNEELATLNDELQNRNAELRILSDDLSNLLASVAIPILLVGPDHRIRRFTPAAAKAMNLIPTDVGRPISNIKSALDVDLDPLISDVVEKMAPKEIDVRNLEGYWNRLQIRPYRTAENKIDGAVISVIDIQILKQELKTSLVALDYLSSVADTVPLPFAVIDHKFQLMSANLAFFDYFQYSQKDVGRNFLELLELNGDVAELPRLRKLLHDASSSHKDFRDFEIRHTFPKIGRRSMLISAKPIDWRGDEQPALLVGLEDIDNRKWLEEERNRLLLREEKSHLARIEAENANRAKDLFLATLSHELRTPLNSILIWAQMLRRGVADPEQAKKGAETIELSAKTQEKLINDLLDVSRIMAGKLSLEKVEMDFNAILQKVLESVRPATEAKSITIEKAIDPSIGTMFGDPLRLQQVLSNVLTNAVKFSPEGGRVEIRARKQVERSGDQVEIQVSDTGIGIDPAFLPHVFDRFIQADSTSTRSHGGLGLGLTIVQNIVRAHGGSVRAESAGKGKGSTFTIGLPISADRQERTPKTFSPAMMSDGGEAHLRSAENLKGLRVLVVDDDEDGRVALAECLKTYGIEVMTATSAREALRSLPAYKPDVLVSDIGMPGEDGYSFMRHVRSLPREQGGETPSLALTAYAAETDVKLALSAGYQAHLPKPVDVTTLTEVIAKLISK